MLILLLLKVNKQQPWVSLNCHTAEKSFSELMKSRFVFKCISHRTHNDLIEYDALL